MSSLQKTFNGVVQKETLPLTSLIVGEKYPICELRRVTTRYGIRILAESTHFVVFLPAAYSDAISDDELADFNQKVKSKLETYSLCVREGTNSTVQLDIQ